MLSSILSRLSWWAFVLTVVIGLCKVAGQAFQTPLNIKTGKDRNLSLGKPGIYVLAQTNNNNAATLPDTSSSQIALQQGDSKKVADYQPDPNISETNIMRQTLHIKPSGTLQLAGFIGYDIINYGCLALIFLFLSRLFKNFGRRNYFTAANVALLNKTGWLLLLPQVTALLLYWTFLAQLHPVKLETGTTGSSKPLALYEIHSGTNWQLAALGLGLLVLGYIFRDGLHLKEEQDLTV